MKLARYTHYGSERVGFVDERKLVPIVPSNGNSIGQAEYLSLLAELTEGRHFTDAGWRAQDEMSVPIADVRLLPPVPRPGKIIGIGRNYLDHATEMAVEVPEVPKIFFKWPGAVVGHGDCIKWTPAIRQLDYEVELAVVIGKQARNVSSDAAMKHVAGFTILNDVSERALQMMTKASSTSLAKSLDTFCPMGPWLVSRGEFGDLNDVTLECWVNEEQVQHGNTSQMIFRVPALIEYLSRFLTLEVGDVIATGTPAGVGMFRTPPLWLLPGDKIRMEISGIGRLENSVIAD